MKITETKTANALTAQDVALARRLLRHGLERGEAPGGAEELVVAVLGAMKVLGLHIEGLGALDGVFQERADGSA